MQVNVLVGDVVESAFTIMEKRFPLSGFQEDCLNRSKSRF